MDLKKLQWKISRTKKRLSDDRWFNFLIPIGLITTILLGFVGLRVVHLPFAYALIRADIPVVEMHLNDASYHRYSERASQSIDAGTTTVVLDKKGNLYFGELSAFTKEYYNVRNKFIVRVKDDSPQTGDLLQQLMHWRAKKSDDEGKDRIAVLIPSTSLPVPIVIQVLSDLRYSEQFDRVILGGGLL